MASDTTRRRLTPSPSAPVAPPSESYETFYGLREKPFGVSTDPKFFFPSVGHERLVVDMLTAVAERQPVMLITGQPGIGKTTVCRAVLPQLDRRTMSSLVSEPATSIDDLLKTVLIDFGVVSHDDLARGQHVARDSLAATLDSFLDSLAPLQASAVVVADDAERQPAGVLAALSRFAGGTSASLQIVLVGTGALSARLKEDPGLRALDAAIAVRAELGPLAGDEIAGYVMHRIAVAGTNPRVEFSDAAIARLFELSRGVPGAVNLLCDRAMMHGYEQSAATIDAALVDAAAAEAGALDGSTFGRPPIALIAMTAGVLLVLALAGGAAALWVFRDAVARTVVQWEKLPEPPGGPVLLNPVPLEPIPPP